VSAGVFLSYSSRDRAQLDNLLSALHRADEVVWFDEELGGGDVWWQKILERIRDCDVFLFALSNSSLQSKPCLAELRYAQALHKPVLPIQIGPVESMRVTPVAAVEAIDFQNPDADSGIRLITAIQRARQQSAPLPSPSPDEPPVPFAYLMRLATTITSAELDQQQQTGLLIELQAVIARDGDDTTTHGDLTQLLRTLRDRPDTTESTRIEAKRLLATLEGRSNTAGTTVAPVGEHRARRRIISVGSVLVCVVIGAAILIAYRHRSPEPTALPLVAPVELNSILLTSGEVNTVMGASKMRADPVVNSMSDPPADLSDPDCLGTDVAAAAPVYDGTGWSAVRSQTLSEPLPSDPTAVLVWAEQAAVSFPSAARASTFLEQSAERWKGCNGKVVKETDAGGLATWTYEDLSRVQNTISQLSFAEGGDGWACQHALTTSSNSVLEAIACGQHIRDEATQIVERMTAKAKTQT